MVAFVPRLVPFDILDRFYYLVLLLFGLASAAICYVLETHAEVSGEHLGWRVKIVGAGAVAVVVVWGGYAFVPRVETFNLTIRPRSPDSSPIASGRIIAEFGNRTERIEIRDGEADLKGVPSKFWGKKVKMRANIEGYSTEPQDIGITSDTIEFPLRQPSPREIRGQLGPVPAGGQPAHVFILDDTGTQVESSYTPDNTGQFYFSVRAEPTKRIRIAVCMSNKLAFDDFEEFAPGRTTIIMTKTLWQTCPF